jgi:mannose-6-phosphate isomerase
VNGNPYCVLRIPFAVFHKSRSTQLATPTGTLMSLNENVYPMRLEPIAKDKVWGGRNLERVVGKTLPPDVLIGETWEAWDGCRIANGAHAGRSVHDVLAADPRGMGGMDAMPLEGLPLLFKFIDAHADLSLQVHPDDASAQRLANYPLGKTEAWYVLHAEPHAQVVHGFKYDVTHEQWQAALRDEDLSEVLAWTTVQRGDVLFVPAGLLHAIGKGVVLAEIQQNSDITYRVHDWGRTSRELHLDQAAQVTTLKPMTTHTIPSLAIQHDAYTQRILVACRYFAFERLDIHARCDMLTTNNKFQTAKRCFSIVSCIAGEGELLFDATQSVSIKTGDTFLLPAQLGSYGLAPTGECQLLRSYIPDLRADVIVPLRAAGHDDASIARLGGEWDETNDLLQRMKDE